MHKSSIYPQRKPIRINTPGHAHELTFSCCKRRKLLTSEFARRTLAEAINRVSRTHCFDVWSWVFMPEHVHILIFPTLEDYDVSEILRLIKHPSARRIISRVKKVKPELLSKLSTGLEKPKYRFWQNGGGYDRNYVDGQRIHHQIEYIHMNPVRRGLVENPCDWAWSSAEYWMKG